MVRTVAKVICVLAVLLLVAPSSMHASYFLQMTGAEPFAVGGVGNVGGTGGRFTGNWYDGTTDITNKLIGGFWCADANAYLSTTKMAVDVTQIGAAYVPALSRKEGAAFAHDNGVYNAQFRYKLAAALIAGYYGVGYSDGIKSPTNGTTVIANATDTDIQAVIWYALDDPTAGGMHAVLNAGQLALYANATAWLNVNLNDVRFNRWLLFSPPSAHVGDLCQPFLGEVPEPVFLGFLAVGLTGIYLARRRRLA
jgi:hypothetical protein